MLHAKLGGPGDEAIVHKIINHRAETLHNVLNLQWSQSRVHHVPLAIDYHTSFDFFSLL